MLGRRPRQILVLVLLSPLLVLACSALPGRAPTEPPLLPTRTLAPVRTVAPITPEPTDTSRPLPTSTTSTESESTTTSATATPRAPSMASCIDTKADIGALATPVAVVNTPGQIAFVTLEGNLATVDSAGKLVQALTTDANTDGTKGLQRIYAYPTFSGDGKSLAFVEFTTISGTGTVTETLMVTPAQQKVKSVSLYTTSDDSIPYLDWSPDSQSIAFLTINSNKGELRVIGKDGGTSAVLEQGSSAYWHWRSDSALLAAHIGGSPASDADAHISIVGPKSPTPTRISSVPGNFKAPQYAPDGKHLLYVSRTNDNDDLVLADADGKPICSVAQLDQGASFAWSPDGRRVAWIDSATSTVNPAPLYLYDFAAGIKSKLHDDAVGFFWSPDSKRLAVYSIVTDGKQTTFGHTGGRLNSPPAQTPTRLLRIEMVNVSSGDTLLVADTTPTNTLFAMLTYFDQYARALTPWSPDGSQLVFTSASQTTDTVDLVIATLATSGTSVNLKRITEGVVAFWSPR